MVFVGRNTQKRVGVNHARFSGLRRVGQAVNGQDLGLLGVTDFVRPAENASMANMTMSQADDTVAEQLALQGVVAVSNAEDTVETADQATDTVVRRGFTADGQRVISVADATQPETNVTLVLPAAAEPAPAEECEFPVQQVVLERQVNITNSAPRIINADTDVCGNMISYTEQMTRTMTAGEWRAVSGLQGPLDNLQVEPNGEISLSYDAGADIANSRGFSDVNFPYNVTSQQRVGRRAASRPRAGANNVNRNAAYGASQLFRYRHA